MARPKVNRDNIGKYGVFLVGLTDDEHPEEGLTEAPYGVMQVVDYHHEFGGAYCLLFKGLVNRSDFAAAVGLVKRTNPCGSLGYVASSLRFPEFQYAGPARPSLHYEPPVFMINGDLVVDFADSLMEIIYEDEYPMPELYSESQSGVLKAALRHINGLPHDYDTSLMRFCAPKIPLRKYFPEEVVAAKLAALDRAAGFDAPEFNHLEGECPRRLARDAEQEGGGDEA